MPAIKIEVCEKETTINKVREKSVPYPNTFQLLHGADDKGKRLTEINIRIVKRYGCSDLGMILSYYELIKRKN